MSDSQRWFTCRACMDVVSLYKGYEGRKGFCPECGAEVRWTKPNRPKSGWARSKIIGAAICGAVALLVLSPAISHFLFDTDKVYTEGEFKTLLKGKSEAEVKAILGAPHVEEIEPPTSPLAGKRVLGYAYDKTNHSWRIAGNDAAVGIVFDNGKVESYLFFPKPASGRFIFIRW